MVGDGVNDVFVLVESDIGVVMGLKGVEIVFYSVDVVLMIE